MNHYILRRVDGLQTQYICTPSGDIICLLKAWLILILSVICGIGLPLRYDTEMRPNINVVSDKCLVHPKRWNFHIINYPQQQSNHNDGPRETSCQHTDTWGNTRYALEYDIS